MTTTFSDEQRRLALIEMRPREYAKHPPVTIQFEGSDVIADPLNKEIDPTTGMFAYRGVKPDGKLVWCICKDATSAPIMVIGQNPFFLTEWQAHTQGAHHA